MKKINFKKTTLEPLIFSPAISKYTQFINEGISNVLDFPGVNYIDMDRKFTAHTYFLDYKSYGIRKKDFLDIELPDIGDIYLTPDSKRSLAQSKYVFAYNVALYPLYEESAFCTPIFDGSDLLLGFCLKFSDFDTDTKCKDFMKRSRSIYHILTYYKDKPYEFFYARNLANPYYELYCNNNLLSFNRNYNLSVSRNLRVGNFYSLCRKRNSCSIGIELFDYVKKYYDPFAFIEISDKKVFNEKGTSVKEIILIYKIESIFRHIYPILDVLYKNVLTPYKSTYTVNKQHFYMKGGYIIEITSESLINRFVSNYIISERVKKGDKNTIITKEELEKQKASIVDLESLSTLTIPFLSDFITDENYYHVYLLIRYARSFFDKNKDGNIYKYSEIFEFTFNYTHLTATFIKFLMKYKYIDESFFPTSVLLSIEKYYNESLEILNKIYSKYTLKNVLSTEILDQHIIFDRNHL